jgi:hypothetical protein
VVPALHGPVAGLGVLDVHESILPDPRWPC